MKQGGGVWVHSPGCAKLNRISLHHNTHVFATGAHLKKSQALQWDGSNVAKNPPAAEFHYSTDAPRTAEFRRMLVVRVRLDLDAAAWLRRPRGILDGDS